MFITSAYYVNGPQSLATWTLIPFKKLCDPVSMIPFPQDKLINPAVYK